MASTNIRGTQVVDGSIQRLDLDTTTVGKAVVAKIIQGTGIALSSTGADSGTGDVTISNNAVSSDANNMAVKGSDNLVYVPGVQTTLGPAAVNAANSGGPNTVGIAFQVTIPCLLTQITWAKASGETATTHNVKIWNGDSSTVLKTITTSGEAAGPITITITVNPYFVLQPGINYWLTIDLNTAYTYNGSGIYPRAILPINAFYSVYLLGSWGAPTSTANASYGLDFTVVSVDSGPPKHQITHQYTGIDQLNLDTLGWPSDNTNLNASTTAHGLLAKLPGTTTTLLRGNGTFATLGISTDTGNLAVLGSDSLVSVPTSSITSIRLRTWNAVSNSSFEVDQRNVGGTLGYAAGTASGWGCDRWLISKVAATAVFSSARQSGVVNLPGTSFAITQGQLQISINTAQATLAAGEYIQIYQAVEGPMLRELINDVHSISVLAQCSQPMTFSVALSSQSGTIYSLTQTCQITTANTPTLFTLPNLSKWPAGGTWPIAPGNVGYILRIGLGAGSTYTSPSNGTWNAGTFICGPGTTNFASLPTGTVFALLFVQHEPSQCTTLQDLDWLTNYDRCLRMYQKSYEYGTAVGTNTGVGVIGAPMTSNLQWLVLNHFFPKTMAKAPTVTPYSVTGTANNMTLLGGGNVALSSSSVSSKGIMAVQASANQTAGAGFQLHYTADTGW